MNTCLTLKAFANCAPKFYYFADGDWILSSVESHLE